MTTEEPTYYWVFVYGSLREGLHNHRMLRGCAVEGPIEGVVEGFTLYSGPGDAYPYLGKAKSGKGAVVGELYKVEYNQAFQSIVNMELGAGYDVEITPVFTKADDTMKALVFVHEEQFRYVRGPVVVGGDWTKFKKRADKRWQEQRQEYKRQAREENAKHNAKAGERALKAEVIEHLPARRKTAQTA